MKKYFTFVLLFVLVSCGRAWRGEKFKKGEILVVPVSSDIVSLPEMEFEIRQWDFTLDELDKPYVAFYNSFQGSLSFATLTEDGRWDLELVDPEIGRGILAGQSPNIFFVNKKLHVVYLATSIRDKVPKFYVIKEAVRDELGVWRCRIIKKWTSPIRVIKAGYIQDIGKIGITFIAPEEKTLIFGVYTPSEENLKLCKVPKTEDEETEDSDFRYTTVYYFGQGELRLKNELDSSCNPAIESRVGYSLDIIPTFTKRKENFFGIALYDPVLNQSYWIEFKQKDILKWLDGKEKEEVKSEDKKEIVRQQINYNLRQEGICNLVSSTFYKVELSEPADLISKAFYKNSAGAWKAIEFFKVSPTIVYLKSVTDSAYPLQISIIYTPMFHMNVNSIGMAKTNISVSADKNGNIHMTDFIFLPPLFAIEYGIITTDENGKFLSRFEVLDGGGGGIYTQGTGGNAISVRADGVPIVAYFSPFTADLKLAIPVRDTWISVPKLSNSVGGMYPKILLTRSQNTAVLLTLTVYRDRRVLQMLFIPLTL